MIKNYNLYINIFQNNFKINESTININWNNWNWEEEEEDKKYVTTYNGEKILRDKAVWCVDVNNWGDPDFAKFSYREGEYYSENSNELIWVNSENDYIHLDDIIYSYRYGILLRDKSVWCKYENDICPIQEAVKLENGIYAFPENVKLDYKGKKYHKDTLIWDNEINGYVYNNE